MSQSVLGLRVPTYEFAAAILVVASLSQACEGATFNGPEPPVGGDGGAETSSVLPDLLDASDAGETKPEAIGDASPANEGTAVVPDARVDVLIVSYATNADDASILDISCNTVCPVGSTCFYLNSEAQPCGVSCAGITTIATIVDVYATNCNPTPCPVPLAGCQSSSGCTVDLENSACGGDPCPYVKKNWSVTITCSH